MNRSCNRGHLVTEDYLKVCPHCGGPVPGATGKVHSLAPQRPDPVDVPKLKPFLFGGLVLVLFGLLLTLTAEQGPAEVFGWVMLAGGLVVAGVGIYDGVRRSRPS